MLLRLAVVDRRASERLEVGMKLALATLAAVAWAGPALACPMHQNHTAQSDGVKIAQSQRADGPSIAPEEKAKVDPDAAQEASDGAKGG